MNPDRTNILQLHNLSIGYKKSKPVCEGLNLQLANGELTALIGLNGIGKSTLLKTITNLMPPLQGKVTIGDKEVKSMSHGEFALECSVVSTFAIRVSHLTVFNLVALGRHPHTSWLGKLTEKDKRKVIESIEMVGLTGFENRFVSEISDGERQRAIIARAIAQDTSVIILDEPTAWLDVKNKYEVVNLLHQLAKKQHKAILFSTHDLSNAIQEVDKLWVMDGNKVFEGAPEDLVLNGKINDVFSTDDMFFNYETSNFQRNRKYQRSIKVEGEGERFIWTKKALERNNYKISNSADQKVYVNSDNWILAAGEKEFELYTIASLIDQLRYC